MLGTVPILELDWKFKLKAAEFTSPRQLITSTTIRTVDDFLSIRFVGLDINFIY